MDDGQRKELQGLIDRDGSRVVAERLGVDVATLGRWILRASEPSNLAQERIDKLLATKGARR